ncbi:MAG TPA: cell division protein ZapE, partial [Acetobacteraceae bacterium]
MDAISPTALSQPSASQPAIGPLPAYRARLADGRLTADPSQLMAAERLQGLWVRLRGYDPVPKPAENPGLLARLFGRKPTDGADEPHPNG